MEKYEVIIKDLYNSDKSLEEMTDVLVKTTQFDGVYGALGGVENDDLVALREVFMDFIEQGKSQEFINKFHFLLEVERELTLREE
jgi:hypothetical protein